MKKFSYLVVLTVLCQTIQGIQDSRPKTIPPKSLGQRALLFAKGTGMLGLSIASLVGFKECAITTVKKLLYNPIAAKYERKRMQDALFAEEFKMKISDLPPDPEFNKEITEMKAGQYRDTAKKIGAAGIRCGILAAILYTNYTFLLPKAYAYFKEALS